MNQSRRRFLVSAASAAALAACARATRRVGAPPSPSPATRVPAAGPSPASVVPGAPARFVRQGSADRRVVALTFHGSGDLGLTNQLLDDARRLRAPITVFAVGQWLDANPSMASRIQADGNELANHTYTHPALGQVSRSGVDQEIVRCRDVLRRLTGAGGRWFRPSGVDVPTPLMLEEAANAGYSTIVGYDVDPLDYQDPGAAAVIDRVRAKLHPGAIVSLHTGHQGTVSAFEPIVAAARAAGLQPVVLSDLLG